MFLLCIWKQRGLWQDCTGSPEPSLLADVIKTKISCGGSNFYEISKNKIELVFEKDSIPNHMVVHKDGAFHETGQDSTNIQSEFRYM